MKFPKPTHKNTKKLDTDTNLYTTPVTTTVSVGTKRKFEDWNMQNPTNKITWADSIRKGFYNILREKDGQCLDDISMNKATYVPIQIKEKIKRMAKTIQELSQQMHKLQGGTKK